MFLMFNAGPLLITLLPVGALAGIVYAAAPPSVRTRYRLYRLCGHSRVSALANVAISRRKA